MYTEHLLLMCMAEVTNVHGRTVYGLNTNIHNTSTIIMVQYKQMLRTGSISEPYQSFLIVGKMHALKYLFHQ